jgi:GGDEF-like domain/PucR C-terminal helix-turn-helix domain
MGISAAVLPRGIQQARAELAERLNERRAELEAAVRTRVYGVQEPKSLDPLYAEGLSKAIAAAIEYGLGAIELGERRSPPPPPILLAQARVAARAGVSLDTVLRRYVAGHSLIIDVLVEEAERGEIDKAADLQGLLRAQATLFDRLLAAVSEEHSREHRNRLATSEERRRERVKRLLAGELLDSSELGYELDAHHLGLMAKGEGVEELLRETARRLDRRLLAVRREEEPVWACWLGGRRQIDPEEARRALTDALPPETRIALGEPGEGAAAWRLSHRQAKAALAVAERGEEPLVRYAEVALLASLLQDELLLASLREMYLKPLEAERDGGEVARETLRAYFAAERNAASAALALGVSRQAVNSRLRTIEAMLGRSLCGCAAELEMALCVDELASENPTLTGVKPKDSPIVT